MMDSRTPSTPVTPYGQNPNQYKVNVSRTKTRKWVEAKTQNYDGDDWGADDDFNDLNDNDGVIDEGSPEVCQAQQVQIHPQRPGRLTAGLRAISAGGVSTPLNGSAGSSPSLRPSERIALERQQAAMQRSVTGPPALHLHTQQPRQTSPIPQVAGPPGPGLGQSATFPPRKSSIVSQERPDFANPAARPPRTSSRPESPAGALRSPVSVTGPPKVVRPAEIYKRMEQEKEKERSSMESSGRPSLDSTGQNDGDNESGTKPPRRPSFGMNDTGDSSRGLRPLESVAERKSEYGFDGLMVNSGGPSPPGAPNNIEPEPMVSSQAPPPTLQHPQARKGLHPGSDPMKRYSTSPTLPEMARMSGFGGDFFGAGGLGFGSDAPEQSRGPVDSTTQQPQTSSITTDPGIEPAPEQATGAGPSSAKPAQAAQIRPSLPGSWVTETPTPGEAATPGVQQANYSNDSVANANASDVPTIHMQPAPLGGPSPGNGSAGNTGDASRYNGLQQPGDAEPTKNDRDVQEPQPTSNASALAIAPLQPRKGSVPESPPEDLRPLPQRQDTYSTMDNSSPLKESDFLRDEIMRSLSPSRPADGAQDTPQDDAGRESAYLNDVYGDYWDGEDKKRGEVATTEQTGNNSGEHEPTSTSAEPTAAKPELNRDRFSWEAGSEPNKSSQPSPMKQPLSESPNDFAGPTSAGPPEHTGPADAGQGSPFPNLPTLNLGDSEMNSQGVSAVSEAPPGQRQSIAELPSPMSNPGDRDGPSTATGDHESNALSNSDDKILVQSPMSPMSPMEPIGMQDNDDQPQDTQRTGTPAEAAPEGVPLPRSPSPTKPRSQPAYNSMTLKQILQLPTSADRVQKMQETREHFSEVDNGLSGWLSEMLSHESHENAMPTFNYALSGADAELWGTKGGARIPLNAPAEEGGQGAQSNAGGGGNAPHIGRSASGSVNLGNLMMHSGQAGVKGKELLQSAGKLSKGLLSKGKNKLRERAESKKG